MSQHALNIHNVAANSTKHPTMYYKAIPPENKNINEHTKQ